MLKYVCIRERGQRLTNSASKENRSSSYGCDDNLRFDNNICIYKQFNLTSISEIIEADAMGSAKIPPGSITGVNQKSPASATALQSKLEMAAAAAAVIQSWWHVNKHKVAIGRSQSILKQISCTPKTKDHWGSADIISKNAVAAVKYTLTTDASTRTTDSCSLSNNSYICDVSKPPSTPTPTTAPVAIGRSQNILKEISCTPKTKDHWRSADIISKNAVAAVTYTLTTDASTPTTDSRSLSNDTYICDASKPPSTPTPTTAPITTINISSDTSTRPEASEEPAECVRNGSADIISKNAVAAVTYTLTTDASTPTTDSCSLSNDTYICDASKPPSTPTPTTAPITTINISSDTSTRPEASEEPAECVRNGDPITRPGPCCIVM